MISSLISPFRWYDKYYQQNRWDIECRTVCEFKLITDRRHLLPFQFKRPSSLATITSWVLRRCCDDPTPLLLTEQESIFAAPSWVPANDAWIPQNCGGITANVDHEGSDNTITYDQLTIGMTYTVQFFVNEFLDVTDDGIGVSLQVKSGATVLQTIDSAGTYEITFRAMSSEFTFNYQGVGFGDLLSIRSVQFTQIFIPNANDVILNTAMLSLFNAGDSDYIMYCGQDLGLSIPEGCYYSIIKDSNGNLYYSEVITVLDFNPNASPYFILEWFNSCDITDVIYHSVAGACGPYKNRLYLPDAVLTRPEYPFIESGEEDGNQNFHATFQKLRKQTNLISYKLPEYIIDALNGVKLHNTIQYYYPIRQKQVTLDAAVEVDTVDADVTYVVNDCFGNVTLKMTLKEIFVDETCCNNVTTGCKECSRTIPELNVYDEDEYEYALVFDGSNYTLYQYINDAWTIIGSYVAGVWTSDIVNVGDLICDDSLEGGMWEIGESTMQFAPEITAISLISGSTYVYTGNVISGSFAQIEYSFDGVNWNLGAVVTKAEINAGVIVNLGILGDTCCPFLSRINMIGLGCDYGVSETFPTPSNNSTCC